MGQADLPEPELYVQTDDLVPALPGRVRTVSAKRFRFYSIISRQRPRSSIYGLPVADPLGRFATIWGGINTCVDLTYTAFAVPASMAFGQISSLDVYSIIDFVGNGFYALDILTEFNIGFLVRWDVQTLTITDGRAAARHYVLRGTFWIDMVATTPMIAQIVFLIVGNTSSQAWKLVQLLKLLRLLRVIRLMSRLSGAERTGVSRRLSESLSPVTVFVVAIVVSVAMLLNLLACLWWWISVVQEPGPNWTDSLAASKPDIDINASGNLTKWLISAYFVGVTITTIGYGDITAQTTPEMILVLVFIVTGVSYFGYLVSTVSNLLNSTGAAARQEVLQKIQNMELWLRQHSFPPALRHNIRRYYINEWTVARAQEDDLFTNLPSWLRLRAAEHMQCQPMASMLLGEPVGLDEVDAAGEEGLLLEGSATAAAAEKGTADAVAATKAEQLAGALGSAGDDPTLDGDRQMLSHLLAEASVPYHLASGRRLYTAGDAAAQIYLLDEGQLMTAVGIRVGAKFDAPAVLGMSALFAGEVPECGRRLHTVRAVSNCRLWAVDAAHLRHRLATLAPGALLRVLGHYVHVAGGVHARMEALPPETAALPAAHDMTVTYGSMLRKLGALQDALLAEAASRAARVAAAASRRAHGGGGGEGEEGPDADLEAQNFSEQASAEEVGDGLGLRELSGRVVLRRRQNSVRRPVDRQVAAQAGMAQTAEGVSYSIW